MKIKKDATFLNVFKSILNHLERNSNKAWVNQGSEFYSRSFRKWSDAYVIEMYSTHNEGKAVVAEKFHKTLKHKVYKHTAAAPKNVPFDVR